jgi:hypothetical protein
MFRLMGLLREIGMDTQIGMETQADRDAIADKAVGQRPGSAPPEAQKKDDLPPEELGRRLATSAGAQASISEKTAESIGERVADAYSDPDLAGRPVSIGRGSDQGVSSPFELQRFLTLVTSFALGYVAAVLLHRRIPAPEPFQITRPPQDDRHPRGFVRSTVLKTIAEHPQGMTAAEIIKALGGQGIGQQSIENALSDLVQAKKVSVQGGAAKYHPVAAEVPTAPDQPSS